MSDPIREALLKACDLLDDLSVEDVGALTKEWRKLASEPTPLEERISDLEAAVYQLRSNAHQPDPKPGRD
jgi:hypothetical protein